LGESLPAVTPATIEELFALAGSLDDESAREMMAAIESECERVDLDDR
jgi:hypothetical protein